jgi:hypothetical protein
MRAAGAVTSSAHHPHWQGCLSGRPMARRALILLLLLWVAPAQAHKPSDSYLALSLAGDRVDGQWDIALRDLDYAIGLDADGNGEIPWGEVTMLPARSRPASI